MAVVTVVQNVNNITNTQEYQTALQKVKFDKPININSMSFYFNGPTTYNCAWVIYSTGFDMIYQSINKPVTAGWNEFKFNGFLNLPAGTYYIGVTTAVNGVGKLTTMQGMSFQSSDISKDVGGTMVTVSPNIYSHNGTSVQTSAMLSMTIDGGIDTNAPTTPGAFTQPTGDLETGDPKVFSVGSSSDAEGNLSKYVWEASINGGSFTKIGETPTNNITYTIPTAKTLKVRVKAVDSQGLESSYRESAVFTVTKPKYYWSKYNILTKYVQSADKIVPLTNSYIYARDFSISAVFWSLVDYNIYGRPNMYDPLYSNISFSTDTGKINLINNLFPADVNTTIEDLFYRQDGITKYYFKTDANRFFYLELPGGMTGDGYMSIKVYEVTTYPYTERGTLVQSGIIAEEGTYPLDGTQAGNWWLRGSRVNHSIAPPAPFTAPIAGTIFKPSGTANIAFGATTAPNLSLYEVDYRYNENAWTPMAYNNTLSRQLGITTDKSLTKLQFRVRAKNTSGVYSDYIYSDVYVIQHNVIPTILLNTANNFIMSETEGQNEVLVDGSARDTDANDNVIIKMQINDGTIRNIQSALSDGSTPIEFSKKITYSNKRVYDGSTPISNDLPENVDHKLKVWADDGQGGISTVEERTFRVIHNRPPVISGTDEDLGELLEIPSITYQVDDPEKQTATITERINGQVIRTFDAELGTEYKIEIPIEMWIPLQLEQEHKLTIEAKDTFGAKSTRTYTFTRIEDTIQLELKNPFVTDIAATRILVTPDVYLPIGSTIVIEACNNAFDEVPTWEDVTGMAMNKRGFHFTNTEKTAEQWGINIRFTLHKGTAHDQVKFNGFGGAFD